MTASESGDDWESLLDSGQLDANIKKLTILQRPKPSPAPAPGPAANIPPVTVLCSDDPRTQFRPSEPVIKIMKRPDGGSGVNSNVQVKPKVEQKSLKQREQEYAEARQRILGSESVEESQPQPKPPAKVMGGAKNSNGVPSSRTPKGPPTDGSRGFQSR